jgi:hypothetical protein
MVLGLVGIVQYVGHLRKLIARKGRVLVAVNEAIPSAMDDVALDGILEGQKCWVCDGSQGYCDARFHMMHAFLPTIARTSSEYITTTMN